MSGGKKIRAQRRMRRAEEADYSNKLYHCSSLVPTALATDVEQSFHQLEPARVCQPQKTHSLGWKPVAARHRHFGIVRIGAGESQHEAHLQRAASCQCRAWEHEKIQTGAQPQLIDGHTTLWGIQETRQSDNRERVQRGSTVGEDTGREGNKS